MNLTDLLTQWFRTSLHNVLRALWVEMQDTFATTEALASLDSRLQMQVEGLPYVDFDFDFDNGELCMEYIEGTDIVENNINYEDGDLVITPTSE